MSIKLRLTKYTDEPEACWIKVEFLRSSVRNWSEPWLQRWMKIFSTWGYKHFSFPQTHKKRWGENTWLYETKRCLLTLSLTRHDSTCSLSRRNSNKHWLQPEDSWGISAEQLSLRVFRNSDYVYLCPVLKECLNEYIKELLQPSLQSTCLGCLTVCTKDCFQMMKVAAKW